MWSPIVMAGAFNGIGIGYCGRLRLRNLTSFLEAMVSPFTRLRGSALFLTLGDARMTWILLARYLLFIPVPNMEFQPDLDQSSILTLDRQLLDSIANVYGNSQKCSACNLAQIILDLIWCREYCQALLFPSLTALNRSSDISGGKKSGKEPPNVAKPLPPALLHRIPFCKMQITC